MFKSFATRVASAAKYVRYTPERTANKLRAAAARWVLESVEDVLPEIVTSAVNTAVENVSFDEFVDEVLESKPFNDNLKELAERALADGDYSNALEQWANSRDGARAIKTLVEEYTANMDAEEVLANLPEDAVFEAMLDIVRDEENSRNVGSMFTAPEHAVCAGWTNSNNTSPEFDATEL